MLWYILSVKYAVVWFAIMLGTAFARAGSWAKSYTYSGKTVIKNDGGSAITRNWRSDGENTDYNQAVLAGHSGTCTSSGTITIKLTWTGAPNNTADPAPPKLWLYLKPSAMGQGDKKSASDGLGDPEQTNGNYVSSSPMGKGKLKSYDSSTGVVTASVTMTATGAATTPPGTLDGQGHMYGAGCAFNLSIHAQPYGMHRVSSTSQVNGDLDFTYNWRSTSGSKSDIDSTKITMYEIVAFPGGNPYQPPDPFASSINNPTKGNLWSPTALNVLDVHSVPLIYNPYATASYTGTQEYYFDDVETMEEKVLLLGPFSITRRVRLTGDGWYYTISKDGEVNSVKLP